MKMIASLAAALILGTVTPVLAQGTGEPDIGVESATLGASLTGKSATATFVLRNDGERTMTLREIMLRHSSQIVIADPETDALDNDGDGETDEADEAFRRRGDDTAIWQPGRGGWRLDPGETITRRLRLDSANKSASRAVGTIALTAIATPSEGRSRVFQETLSSLTVPLTPVTLSLSADKDSAYSAGEIAVISGTVTLPGGTLDGGRITVALPPAMADATIDTVRIGPAIDCMVPPVPGIEEGEAVLRFGRCEIDTTATAADRSIGLSVSSALADAPVEASDVEIANWRALSFYLGVWDGDTLLHAKVVNALMTGSRLTATATLPPNVDYRVGDPVTVQVRIGNRSDEVLSAARLTMMNPETFRCDSARIAGTDIETPCTDDTIPLPDLDGGAVQDIALTLRLRRDARIDAKTGPALTFSAEGIAPRPLPIPRLAMALHDGPSLRVTDRGAWRKLDDIVAATIGEQGRLRLTGTLPPGRYRGAVTLLARMVDARTGAPIAPATLTIPEPTLSITTLDGEKTGDVGAFTPAITTLWSSYTIGFDLGDVTEQADQNRRFSVDFDVALADDANINAGQLLEIAGETTAYGRNTAAGDRWVEILVQEPDLRLKMFSLDEDRIIRPGEPFDALSFTCNYGDSAAYGTVMTLDIPPAVELSAEGASIRAFTVPLETVRDGSLVQIEAQNSPLDSDTITVAAQSITLDHGDQALDPEECVGIALRAPTRIDRTDTLAPLSAALTSLDEYASSPALTTARRYAGARTAPLRFQIPVVRLEPSATIQIGTDKDVEHSAELTVPANLGAFRVALSPDSSTRLDWALFERREGEVTPWRDNARSYPPGSTVDIVMRSTVPDALPLGWVDTSRLDAQVLTDGGKQLRTALRLVLRGGAARAIDTDKRIALDTDCDGDLADEQLEDSLFEPLKDATPGDCIIVRIGFENTGEREVERIVIRDAVSPRTTLLSDSVTVRIAPEPLDDVTEPKPETGILEWQFRGLFRPGAVGEVEYRLRLDPQ